MDWLLASARLRFRKLVLADTSGPYLAWMNNSQVTRFLVSGPREYRESDLSAYITSVNTSPNQLLLGLFDHEKGVHIGNIKLGDIRPTHRRADVGIVIGDPGQWGRGLAAEAISALADHAFHKMGLHKLTAGCYEENIGSLKAFLKAGFIQEGYRKEHFFSDGQFVNEILLGRISSPLSTQ